MTSEFISADPVLAQATRILRLLHIANLRDLQARRRARAPHSRPQTAVNEAIVAVQQFTFNTRVDAKLGEVGS